MNEAIRAVRVRAHARLVFASKRQQCGNAGKASVVDLI